VRRLVSLTEDLDRRLWAIPENPDLLADVGEPALAQIEARLLAAGLSRSKVMALAPDGRGGTAKQADERLRDRQKNRNPKSPWSRFGDDEASPESLGDRKSVV
jgi:hypothetical protein